MAGLAVQRAKKDIMGLDAAQMKLVKSTQQMAYNMIFAGGALLIFGGMVIRAMTGIMEKYATATPIVAEFHREWNRAMIKLANNIAQNLGPTLVQLAKILNIIAEHPIAVKLLFWGSMALVIGGAFVFLWGTLTQIVLIVGMLTKSTTLLSIGMKMLNKDLMGTSTGMYTYVTSTDAATVGTWKLTTATTGLGTSIKYALGAFGAMFGLILLINQVFGRTTAIIVGITATVVALTIALWALYVAESAASLGIAALAGAAGAATATAVAAMHGYQMGTSFVKKGGVALLHGGEEIKSARETTAMSKLDRQRRGLEPPTYTRSTWHLPITIENLYTKSDRDNVARELRRALKNILDKKV